MDACTLCVCHGGAILCQTPTCPPVVCHHPVRPEGQCCATCRGDDLSSLPVTGHHHCRSYTSMMYKHGETWQSTPCQSCTCLDGQIMCYNQMCPPVSCKKTVLRKGQCCPTCVDAPKAKVCIHNDVTYESGEKWQGDNCTQCMCINGHTECFPLPCLNLDCTFGVIKRTGQCCHECYEAPKSEFLQEHNKTSITRVSGDISTAVPSEDESGFDAKAFGFSMLAVAILAIIGIIILARLLIQKSKRYHTRPNDPSIENQKTLIQSEKEQHWQKFTSAKKPEPGKGNRSSNDYAEMVFSDSSKGSYKSSVVS
ncbi:Cysteine-rich motor neuron 1 protein [Bulinus truncatus]|nr:Cysteine-rich motor neuron 1 protein [Bulinus truncatus]